ncbi:hypothetical protein Fot_28425 [Forsythia ovata]|uniref:Uncharacterized protein n=1 Tax=Forsythia ovata TaxID=205694 RepID=A0ABD1TNZ4_9LAMI
MYTSWSHVLNCELYKVLAMKIDGLHSKVVGAKNIEDLRTENNVLYLELVIFKDARAKAEYKVTKAEMLQQLSFKAQKQAELKLNVCEDMAHAKHKELTKALGELSKANELLAKLGASGYSYPKGSAET